VASGLTAARSSIAVGPATVASNALAAAIETANLVRMTTFLPGTEW
jgi:hypothetical protein